MIKSIFMITHQRNNELPKTFNYYINIENLFISFLCESDESKTYKYQKVVF